jgi:uncharacterized protein HemY
MSLAEILGVLGLGRLGLGSNTVGAVRFEVSNYNIEVSVVALLIAFTVVWFTTFVFLHPMARRKGIGMLPTLAWAFLFWAVVVFLSWVIL